MSINASSVLCELNISVWPASKVDREMTDKTNSDAGAVRDASQTRKNLFAGTSLRKDIEKFAARVRLYHNTHTLPWADKGERLLPTKLFLEYKQTMDKYEQTFDYMCDNFYNEYPRLVAEAPQRLGSMFKADDYPDLDEVKLKFGFKRAINPLPEAGDFRLDIPANDLEEVRAEYESKFNERLATAMKAPWERLHEMLTHMSEKLNDTDEETKRRYHDTLLTNPLELCELLTKLNVTNDPKLEEARRQLEAAIANETIEAIRDSADSRANLKTKVDAIIGKFSW